jgi:hypothetical protein
MQPIIRVQGISNGYRTGRVEPYRTLRERAYSVTV